MSPPMPSPFGANASWFASRIGWSLQPGVNLVLEGEHDVRYFRLADAHYRRNKGLRLLGDGFEVLAAGLGQSGGSHAIMEHFHTVFKVAQVDLGIDGRPVYRLAALLDDDKAGREASNYLTAKFTGCLPWRDVFCLKRCYPAHTRDPKAIEQKVRELNSKWAGHDCEIEDLLPKTTIDLFHECKPRCHVRPPIEVAGRWHFEFAKDVKGALCAQVEQSALFYDLREIIDLIRALRFLLSVTPKDGSSVSESESARTGHR